MRLGDGIDFFKSKAEPELIAQLLAACTIWIDPVCFRRLPVWAPYTYRKAPLYKSDWTTRQSNKGEPKREGNVAASKAQNRYLGIAGRNARTRPNWACCHIWGNDDESFQSDYSEVNDPRYFTCAANMVLVPTPLKTFTDTVPEVKSALRFAAYLLYGFIPENRPVPSAKDAGHFLPKSWQVEETINYSSITTKIEADLKKRAATLHDLQSCAGPNYPRDQVNNVVNYWNTHLPECLFSGWTTSNQAHPPLEETR